VSPRSRILSTMVIVILFCAFPFDSQGLPSENKLMNFYGKYISPVDGDRCPMYPSCSSYGAAAFKKHGFFMGWIMTCDRLVRCGRDETRISPGIVKDNTLLTLDPVSANDFWWYREP